MNPSRVGVDIGGPAACADGSKPWRGALTDESGAATSLSVALLAPVFVALAFAAFQAALWSHARTEARVVARDTAALVARSGVTEADAATAAREVLGADTDLSNITVTILQNDGLVSVIVAADAPGIIMGTSRSVDVTVAIPVEELTPP